MSKKQKYQRVDSSMNNGVWSITHQMSYDGTTWTTDPNFYKQRQAEELIKEGISSDDANIIVNI